MQIFVYDDQMEQEMTTFHVDDVKTVSIDFTCKLTICSLPHKYLQL